MFICLYPEGTVASVSEPGLEHRRGLEGVRSHHLFKEIFFFSFFPFKKCKEFKCAALKFQRLPQWNHDTRSRLLKAEFSVLREEPKLTWNQQLLCFVFECVVFFVVVVVLNPRSHRSPSVASATPTPVQADYFGCLETGFWCGERKKKLCVVKWWGSCWSCNSGLAIWEVGLLRGAWWQTHLECWSPLKRNAVEIFPKAVLPAAHEFNTTNWTQSEPPA